MLRELLTHLHPIETQEIVDLLLRTWRQFDSVLVNLRQINLRLRASWHCIKRLENHTNSGESK